MQKKSVVCVCSDAFIVSPLGLATDDVADRESCVVQSVGLLAVSWFVGLSFGVALALCVQPFFALHS